MENKSMLDWEMEYNSATEKLIIAEYGRNVQNLINYTKTIEDPEVRQAYAERIVALMQQIQPQGKSEEDYEEKLWKHLFRISNYELDVEPPEGMVIDREPHQLQPERLEYPEEQARYRHYGHNVQVMIQKALAMEDEEKQQAFFGVIASYMKLAYVTWNREHYVNDEVIKADLEKLSGGKIKLDEKMTIENLQKNQGQSRPSNRSSSSGRRSNRGGGGRRSNRGRRRSRR
jgi:hypothetical protein